MAKIDVSSWQHFPLGGERGLFNIVKGTRLTKADMIEGEINYIGATAMNNGVTNHIANDEHLHPANTITVSYNGSVGEAFYQEERFWASDDVHVLYPKFELNIYKALFLLPLIRAVGRKYKFIDKWKLEDMCNDEIWLPITKESMPDWESVEKYMKETLEISKKKLDALVQVIRL